MYLIFPVIVRVRVIVLCTVYPVALDRTRRQTLLICIMTGTMTMTKNKTQKIIFSITKEE